jgi:hypothetical protein
VNDIARYFTDNASVRHEFMVVNKGCLVHGIYSSEDPGNQDICHK